MNRLRCRAPWHLAVVAFVAFVAGAPGSPVRAQCNTTWLPGSGATGVSGTVNASTMWDPDGAGPATPVLVVGGWFTVAGDTPASNIAMWNPAQGTWSALGLGVNGAVRALTTLANGDLVAAGDFSVAGTWNAGRVARWNGVSWYPVGAGFPSIYSVVYSLAVLPNGDLVAGGAFLSTGGGFSAAMRWNGTSWLSLSSTGTQALVRAMTIAANGDLVAGGVFTTMGGVPADNVARWNGFSWSAMGDGLSNPVAPEVAALVTLPNGDVVAGGNFGNSGATPIANVAAWDGTSWSQVGAGRPGLVQALTLLPSGEVVAGVSSFAAVGNPCAVASFTGGAWAEIGSEITSGVNALCFLPGAGLIAGGSMGVAEADAFAYLRQWTGAAWLPLGQGTEGIVTSLMAQGGGVIASGAFSRIEGVEARNIARWNGATWSPLGTGLDGQVVATAELANGNVLAAGIFTTAGGVPVGRLAQWDGAAWSAFGAPLSPAAFLSTIAVAPDGDVLVALQIGNGLHQVLRWNGSSWTQLGSGMDGNIDRLAVLPSGDLVAIGVFATAGGVAASRAALWNGSAWGPMGLGLTSVGQPTIASSLFVEPNGDLVVGGWFSAAGGLPANNIARWNGSTWSPLGSGTNGWVSAIAALPNGDLVAAGSFTAAGASASRIARWAGGSWTAFGQGLDREVLALAMSDGGQLFVGGAFARAGGSPSVSLARLASTCPGVATSFNTGCTGSAGALALASTRLPWTGGEFRAIASGLPSASLAIGVRGLAQTAHPLAALLPQGAAGCQLLASPDLLDLFVPAAGVVHAHFPIPDTTTLINRVLYYQVLAFELDVASAISSVTSTNGLRLTLGRF